MDLCNESCSSGWRLTVLHGKNFSVGHYMQTDAVLIGTINLNHFILLSLTLTFPGGYKVNTKQNLSASFSHTRFI